MVSPAGQLLPSSKVVLVPERATVDLSLATTAHCASLVVFAALPGWQQASSSRCGLAAPPLTLFIGGCAGDCDGGCDGNGGSLLGAGNKDVLDGAHWGFLSLFLFLITVQHWKWLDLSNRGCKKRCSAVGSFLEPLPPASGHPMGVAKPSGRYSGYT
jgi:hypothetical protein